MEATNHCLMTGFKKPTHKIELIPDTAQVAKNLGG